MNTDTLNSLHPYSVAQAGMAVASAIDGIETKELKLAALAAAFLVSVRAAGVDVSDLLAKVDRMLDDADTYYDRRTVALRQWAREEIA